MVTDNILHNHSLLHMFLSASIDKVPWNHNLYNKTLSIRRQKQLNNNTNLQFKHQTIKKQ